jgi:hypothetical protein
VHLTGRAGALTDADAEVCAPGFAKGRGSQALAKAPNALGVSDKAIARALGVSDKTVSKAIASRRA